MLNPRDILIRRDTMNPYYQHGNITIYKGDCIDVLDRIKIAGKVLVITDPPYGIGENSDRAAGKNNRTPPAQKANKIK